MPPRSPKPPDVLCSGLSVLKAISYFPHSKTLTGRLNPWTVSFYFVSCMHQQTYLAWCIHQHITHQHSNTYTHEWMNETKRTVGKYIGGSRWSTHRPLRRHTPPDRNTHTLRHACVRAANSGLGFGSDTHRQPRHTTTICERIERTSHTRHNQKGRLLR